MSMKSQIAVAVLAFCGPAVGSLCGSNAKEIGGNWYCSAVEQLSYANFGTPGEYNQITSMGSDGSCESVTKSFEGPLAPLDGEASQPYYTEGQVLIYPGIPPFSWPYRPQEVCLLQLDLQ